MENGSHQACKKLCLATIVKLCLTKIFMLCLTNQYHILYIIAKAFSCN